MNADEYRYLVILKGFFREALRAVEKTSLDITALLN
jgi:hypothetical protein